MRRGNPPSRILSHLTRILKLIAATVAAFFAVAHLVSRVLPKEKLKLNEVREANYSLPPANLFRYDSLNET